jgi:hypothetical protein
MHTEISSTLQQIVDADGTIEQAILGMNMKMNEVGNVGGCHGAIYLIG